MGFLPSAETVKQFLAATIVPAISASVVTWLASHKVLNVIGISGSIVSTTFSQTLIWLAGYGVSFLAAHHILKGNWIPTATKHTMALEQVKAEHPQPPFQEAKTEYKKGR